MTKPRRDPGYKRLSDSELNARALENRSRTYADPHAKSWEVKFDRATHEPRTLREYVHELRKAYQDEVPGRIHSRGVWSGRADGRARSVDPKTGAVLSTAADLEGGSVLGAPAMDPQFEAYISAGPRATDEEDNYLRPFSAALAYLESHPDETMRTRGRIVRTLVLGGENEDTACSTWHPFERVVAKDAVICMWRSMSSIRISTRRTKEAA